MRFRVLIISSVLWWCNSAANAEDITSLTGLRGTGVGICSEFSNFYQAQPSLAEIQYFSWTQGFMSGLNMNDEAGYRDLSSISEDDQLRFILDFCTSHPTSAFKTGVYELYRKFKMTRPPTYKAPVYQ